MSRAPRPVLVFPRLFLGSVFVVLALMAFRPVAPAHAAPSLDASVARVIDLTNAERARAGLPPLTPSASLTAAAEGYSHVLAAGDCFGHACGPVPEMVQRIQSAGYDGWTNVGENVAAGFSSPEDVVAGWMASPGHRENILSPRYTEIGIGLAGGGKYGTYWAEEFGSRGTSTDAPAGDANSSNGDGGSDGSDG